MRHHALIVCRDQEELDYMKEVLFSLHDKYDMADCQAMARRRIKKRRYDYVIVSAPMYVCSSSRVASPSVIDNFLDEMDEIYKGKLVPMIVIVSHKARAWTGEIMGASRGRRVLIRFIHNPFPRRGETLDRIIKHLVSHADMVNRMLQHVELTRPERVANSDSEKETTAVPALTKAQLDILQAMAESRHRVMKQTDIIAAGGHSKHVTRQALKVFLRLSLIKRPFGSRGGYALTDKARAAIGDHGNTRTTE
ncbi:MAG: hypothetical protein ABFD92_07985 [Planctomycetaceae bacterium]|nr:hypothetical protein [Planctomycetaceae bacterium]